MSKVGRIPPALKHGIYSPTTVLPGESPAAFEKLHRALIAELAPAGALEDDIVATVARLVWRKQNLTTLRTAQRAYQRREEIRSRVAPSVFSFGFEPLVPVSYDADPASRKEAIRAAEQEVRRELGGAYGLIEIAHTMTVDRLEQDFAIEERLDGMIDKCLKRLLFLRGLKSISASALASRQHIAGETKAA
jgi:hypothetical protein